MAKKVQSASSINQIKDDKLVIIYKGKRFVINVTKELQVDENIINSQLKQHPSNYAFLCLVKDHYINKRVKLERERDTAYHKAWVYYKESGGISNDLAEHKAASNPKYLSISERYEKINFKANKLISVCKAYESREKIIQSLNANLRKQS